MSTPNGISLPNTSPSARPTSPIPPPLSTRQASPSPPNTAAGSSHAATRSRFGAESAMGLLVENLKDRLLFAVPKKGRLYEKCLELLAGADIKYNRAHRLDVALVQNHPIALVFLPAADIPRFVALGSVALGITGQDMIAESTHSSELKELLKLGFGKCQLQVQVPVNSPYQSIEELAGRRIATSFEVLAQELFRKVDEDVVVNKGKEKEVNGSGNVNGEEGGNGVEEEGEGERRKTQVEYVGGSVEAACALGMADGIVDLVESGDTMRAAGLHPIHTLLSSEAVLITSLKPHPTITPSLEHIVPMIRSRIAGVIAAKKFVYCSYNIPREHLEKALKITPGRRAPTVSPIDEEGWVAVSAMVEKKETAKVMDELELVGAEDVLILNLENCRIGL